MLDPPPPVAAVFRAELFIDADNFRIGGIADGVNGDLESAGGRLVGVGQHVRLASARGVPRVEGMSA